MSVVGPRPEMLENVDRYTREVPEFEYRNQMKAGLTGLAQIDGKYNTSPKDKVILDLLYIEKFSLSLDIKLMLRTITVFFRHDSTEGFRTLKKPSPMAMRIRPRGKHELENHLERRRRHGHTLLIMAAGMGSRYGGDKQIDGMGPHNEILLEYSVYDALEAGFNKVVFIIKHDFEDRIREIIGDRLSRRAKVEYVFQDFSSLPSWYAVPAERTKPFGTVHAVLCARDVLREPFAVINADDYYGRDPYERILGHLHTLKPEKEACMVCYRLKNTVSELGP